MSFYAPWMDKVPILEDNKEEVDIMIDPDIQTIKEQILQELKNNYVLVPKKTKYQRADYDNFREWLKEETKGIPIYYSELLPLLKCKYKCKNIHNLPLEEKEDDIKEFVKNIIKLVIED